MSNSPSHRRPARTSARPALPPVPLPVGREGVAHLSRAAVRHGLRAGDLEPLGRGVVVPVDAEIDPIERRREERRLLRSAQASSLRCERAVISHLAAVIARGVPTYGPLVRPCPSVPTGTALRHLASAHLHRASVRPEDVSDIGGFPVLALARSVVDIAREHGVAAAVVAADHALNHELIDAEELLAALDRSKRWPGHRRARAAVELADDLAESPLESVSRLRMFAAGLPAPQLQVEFCDMNGEYITRSDFYWPEYGVVGEADGLSKLDSDGRVQRRQDHTHTALLRTGLEVVRWGWSDLYPFIPTVREIERAFRRGLRPGSPLRRWGIVLPRTA